MSVDTVTRSFALRTICLTNILLILTFASSDATGNSSLPWNDGNTTVSYGHGVTGPPINSSLDDFNNDVDTGCKVSTVDIYLYNKVNKLLTVEKVSLVEYRLRLVNYTDDPLLTNTSYAYRLNKWSRITTSHGQTLLGLAFNYGVLSIMTLTLGTTSLDVALYDSPEGCFGTLSEQDKINTLLVPLTRDFKMQGGVTFVNEERVCHPVVLDRDGYANFKDRCYTRDPNTGKIVYDDGFYNVWLSLLYALLLIVKFVLLFFGPCLFLTAVLSMSKDNVPYVVKLKESLKKTIAICTHDFPASQELKDVAKRVIDLSSVKGFPKLREATKNLEPGKPHKVEFKQYDITVNYKRMLTENVVPVGLLENLFDAIFKCKIANVGPFQQCCRRNALSGCGCVKDKHLLWLKFWKYVANLAIILLIPFPYYIRLILFYVCEYSEVNFRKDVILRLGLKERYESSLVHYFTPTHPFFIAIYVIYFFTAIILGFLTKKNEGRLLKIIVGSFRDLETLNWTETMSMAVSNVIWPFKKFGFLGCLITIVYWPIAIPLTAIVCAIYSLPTIYLTIRMAFYSKTAIFERLRRRKKNKPYQVSIKVDQDMHKFETEALMEAHCNARTDASMEFEDFELNDIDIAQPKEHFKTLKDTISLASSIVKYHTVKKTRLLHYVLTAIVCIATLYAVVIILSEVIGCLVEIIVFTIMGIIVNASALLKYVMLVLMVFGYSCDCFNNMAKKYLKLNKALFGEVKGRIKDLSDVTSLPSFLQENRGFKSQELNEQAEYESPDDVAKKPKNHWMINDLVLFIDSEDMPRIPKQLFDEVCQIRVAGVPGPVFRGHIEAFEQFLKIVVFIIFVFIIVLTFGAVYQVSSTNQMLATMVGGFLPMVLKTFLSPPAPDIEIGTVSFKSKMDEVIKNFCQYWPIFDLEFHEIKQDPTADSGKGGTKDPVTESKVEDAVPGPTTIEITDEQGMTSASAADTFATSNFMRMTNEDVNENKMLLQPDAAVATSESGLPTYYDAVDGGSVSQKHVTMTEPSPAIELDILIIMPERFDDIWLDEWSDLSRRSSRMSISKENNQKKQTQDVEKII